MHGVTTREGENIMGEKIKDMGTVDVQDTTLSFEWNCGTKAEAFDIHIQNAYLQFSFKDREFLQFAAATLQAEKNFEQLKQDRGAFWR